MSPTTDICHQLDTNIHNLTISATLNEPIIPFSIFHKYSRLIDTTLLITTYKQFPHHYKHSITTEASYIIVTIWTKNKVKVISYTSSPCSQLLLYVLLPTAYYLQTRQTVYLLTLQQLLIFCHLSQRFTICPFLHLSQPTKVVCFNTPS